MSRLVRLIGVLAAATAASAHAQAEHDEQAWTAVTAVAPVSERLDVTMEAHARYTDGMSRLGQLLLRPSVTLKLRDGFSVSGGYVYARTRPLGGRANDEHRSWEQIAYDLHRTDRLAVTGRTRLEQRFRPDSSGTGWRLRQQIRAQLPIERTPVKLVVWNESFFGLNDTRWGARAGTDQVRTFVGLALPVTERISVEPGYFNQTVFRVGPDRVNHALAAFVTARF